MAPVQSEPIVKSRSQDDSVKLYWVFLSTGLLIISFLFPFSFPHLFLLSSGVLWYLATSFWFPDETACILWREKKPNMRQFSSNTQSYNYWRRVFPAHWPLAWSLSSWLAVFFHSSILSWSGVTRPSIRALHGREERQESEREEE